MKPYFCAPGGTRTPNNGSEDRRDIHFTTRAMFINTDRIEQKWLFVYLYVRIGRIELPSYPWQGHVLPLNHTRI
jgi:hypothetical protein